MIFSTTIFLALASWIIAIESKRHPDLLSIFNFIFFLQITLPGIFIPLLILLIDQDIRLNIYLDRVYYYLTGTITTLTALLSALFLIFVHAGYYFQPASLKKWNSSPKKIIVFSSWKLFFIQAAGIISMIYLLTSMPGSNLSDKYFSLILFRAQHESIFEETRNFITSNLFSLSQTFAISTIFLLFYLKDREKRLSKSKLFIVIALMIFMATFTASRRSMLIQILIIYFATVLIHGRWYLKYISIPIPLAILWLGFGKDLLWQIPSYISGENLKINLGDQNNLIPILNAFSSLGVSLNSSWATLMFMNETTPRFGSDHILTALRFLPLGSFGVDEYQLYGPRIVRISTEAFVDKDALDIPPGLIGQMWLDFGVLGPIVWGLIFGIILRNTNNIFKNINKTWVSCGIFSILAFIIALPINSGSLDYNFSVDMFFLLSFLWWATEIKNSNHQ